MASSTPPPGPAEPGPGVPGPQEPGPGAPAPRPRVVVGAALIAGGRVLAARRSAPAEVAGRWEFPGGKLEAGETEAEALVRELREELGVETRALARIPGVWPVRADLHLHIWTAALLSGTPAPLQDHSELRWLTAAELDTVDWLDQDRFALPAVAALLPVPVPPVPAAPPGPSAQPVPPTT